MMNKSWTKVLALLIVALAHGPTSCDAARVLLPKGLSWANLAWGFKDGGSDTNIAGRKLVLVDLFDDEIAGVAADTKMAELLNDDHIVMCYMSAGTAEDWRPDFDDFKNLSMTQPANWPSEFYLDISRTDELVALMATRLEYAVQKGCHAIEPDNVDCYSNSECYSGLSSDFDTSLYKNKAAYAKALEITYVQALATKAHDLGLSIVLKNAGEIVDDVESYFDGVLTENCYKYDECSTYSVFPDSDRAHFNTEYIYRSAKTSARTNNCADEATRQTKYCASNRGEWLCKSSSWNSCSEPEDELPETTWIDGRPSNDEIALSSAAPTASPTFAPTRSLTTCDDSDESLSATDVVFVFENMNMKSKGMSNSDFEAAKVAAGRLASGLDQSGDVNFGTVDVYGSSVNTQSIYQSNGDERFETIDEFLSALEALEYRGATSKNKGLDMDKAFTEAMSLFTQDVADRRAVIVVFAKFLGKKNKDLKSFQSAVENAQNAGIQVVFVPIDADKKTQNLFDNNGYVRPVDVVEAADIASLDTDAWEEDAMSAMCTSATTLTSKPCSATTTVTATDEDVSLSLPRKFKKGYLCALIEQGAIATLGEDFTSLSSQETIVVYAASDVKKNTVSVDSVLKAYSSSSKPSEDDLSTLASNTQIFVVYDKQK